MGRALVGIFRHWQVIGAQNTVSQKDRNWFSPWIGVCVQNCMPKCENVLFRGGVTNSFLEFLRKSPNPPNKSPQIALAWSHPLNRHLEGGGHVTRPCQISTTGGPGSVIKLIVCSILRTLCLYLCSCNGNLCVKAHGPKFWLCIHKTKFFVTSVGFA